MPLWSGNGKLFAGFCSLPIKLLQHLWWNAASKPLQLCSLKRCASFSSVEKHQAGDNMAEAHSCVTLSPNNLEPLRGCLLAGAGALCVPEKRYREDCSFAAPSRSTDTHPPGRRWYCILVEVLSLLKESVDTRDPKTGFHCFRARRRSWFGPSFRTCIGQLLLQNRTPQNLIG